MQVDSEQELFILCKKCCWMSSQALNLIIFIFSKKIINVSLLASNLIQTPKGNSGTWSVYILKTFHPIITIRVCQFLRKVIQIPYAKTVALEMEPVSYCPW